ncbi:uncharacterized protein LOC127626655 [Xyrauchen texanus]|uniref:uncharacterized protein LOC127626655 n=1 Tax=Xyrauchen texanus TaxID=154827 RepID=UPI00224189A1|nr:uncharacterized protein LOC127626655 [Xyrauchen texanus]
MPPACPHCTLCNFVEVALKLCGSPVTVGVADERFESPPTVDILQPSTEDGDPLFGLSGLRMEMPSPITGNKVFQSTPLVQTPTSMSYDIKAFDPLLDISANTQNDIQSKHSRIDYATLFTSPDGTKKDISPMGLQNGKVQGIPEVPSPNTSPSLTFRRRPLKPARRSRALKTTSYPSTSMQTLLPYTHSTPTPGSTASVQNETPASENDLPFFENVLLIGQETCVEDWPENSPELSPEWKPVGKLKLRRDYIQIAEVSDGPPGTDVIAKKNGKLTLGKKARRPSFLNRRSSKDKIGDEPKSSQLDTLGRGSKLNGDGTNGIFSSYKDQNEAAEFKSKKSSKPKIIHMQRRESKVPEIDKYPEEENPEEMDGQESDDSKLKGACGFTPHPDLKEKHRLDELKGVCGYTPHSEFKAADHKKEFYKGTDYATPSDGYGKHQEMQDCRPKKPIKFKIPRFQRRHSKSIEDAEVKQQTTIDHYAPALKKSSILQVPSMPQRDSKCTVDEVSQKGADLFKAGDHELLEDADWEEYTPDNKPQKSQNISKHYKGFKNKVVKDFPDYLEPPGAISGDYYLSDATKVEWMSAQMDMRRAQGQEEDQRLEEEEEEGDTDSLMEWWNTVEFWDELPSDEQFSFKEDETISFKAIADKVHRGLRVYMKLFVERAELLYQHVMILYTIADDLSNFHHHAKIANITGGTTTAVGGAAAIVGLILAPVTFGVSIVISAIGLGVATVGGITAASATIMDNVNNMHDRRKIEIIVQDYETQLVEMQRCLQFITEGLRRLRGHPLLRRNNYFTGDWEVRRGLQTISFVSDPVEHAEEITNNTLAKLASLHKGMDKYFTKDSKEVKKGCKKEVTAEVKSLAKKLQEGLVELNSIREQLLDACGNI